MTRYPEKQEIITACRFILFLIKWEPLRKKRRKKLVIGKVKKSLFYLLNSIKFEKE